ncbi:hypothetical protein [Modestobacter sp. NPDC049651]|uniref:hypothetical protein n=1 Tax=Modestobacter sp. NPDC049651 TaxID=3155777 RepID=UPI0033C5A6F7
MSPRTRAGGVAGTRTTAATGHEPNVTASQPPLHYGHNMDHQRHQASQTSAIEGIRDEADAGEKVGVFERHHWLVPATVVAAIVGAFLLMFILTWVAGGEMPFTD